MWTIKNNFYLDLEKDLLLELQYKLDADLLPERAGESVAEQLPDFDRADDFETELDLLWDCEWDLELDAEQDLDRLLDLERLHEGERLPEQLREGKQLPERDLLPECEWLLDPDLPPERDLDIDRLHETLLDFNLHLRAPDRDKFLDLWLLECEWELELKIIKFITVVK